MANKKSSPTPDVNVETVTATATAPESAPPQDVDVATPAKPAKLSWRQEADRLFLGGLKQAEGFDAAKLAKEAEKRAEFLVAAIKGNRHGRSNYSKTAIAEYEFELKALRSGMWRPGLRPPKSRQDQGYNFNVLAVPGAADPQEAALDRLLTDDGGD